MNSAIYIIAPVRKYSSTHHSSKLVVYKLIFFVHLNHLVCILLLFAVAAKIHDDEGHLMSNNEAHVITFK